MLEALRVQLAALGKEGRLEASQPRLVAPLDDLERLVLVEPYLKAVRGRRSEAVLVRARVVPPCVDAELRARLGVSEVAPLLVERERERERERENRTYRSVPAAVEALRGKTRSGWLLRAAPSERELRTHRTDPFSMTALLRTLGDAVPASDVPLSRTSASMSQSMPSSTSGSTVSSAREEPNVAAPEPSGSELGCVRT